MCHAHPLSGVTVGHVTQAREELGPLENGTPHVSCRPRSKGHVPRPTTGPGPSTALRMARYRGSQTSAWTPARLHMSGFRIPGKNS